MLALDYLVDPSATAIKPVIAVFGDDSFLQQRVVHAIANQPAGDHGEMAETRFNGDQASLSDVLDEARMLPFLASRRLVIVDPAEKFVTAHRAELEHYADHPSSTGVLTLVVQTWTSTTKLAKKVEKMGLAVDCRSPDARQLPKFLKHLAESEHRVKIDADAVGLLLDLVGPESGLLASELSKLATYVGERKAIVAADVARMTGSGRVEEIWNILDAATTGNGAHAVHDLDRLLASGEAPVRILAAFTASLLKVHHAGRLRRLRIEAREALRQAGIPPFAQEKTMRQHTHLGPTRVDALPTALLQTDLDVKGSTQLTPQAVLERMVVELARPRQD